MKSTMKGIMNGNNNRTMKKYIFSTLAIAMMMTMAACSSSDNDVAEKSSDNKTVKMTFTAIQENSVGTRTTLGGESGKQVIWESGDKINVNGSEYTLKEGVGTNKGTFEGYTTTGHSVFLAVYPYVNNMQTADFNSFEITFPSQQSAKVGTFDKNAAFMMAKATQENTTLNFKNAVALVKVTPKFNCQEIELKAKEGDTTDPLAGEGYVSYNNGEPCIVINSEKKYSIKLNGPIEKDKTYYIAVPTVTLNAGWSISFTDENNNVFTRRGTKEIQFTRNTVINLGDFSRTDNNLKLKLTKNGEVEPENQVDMGVFTIGTNQYRVIFTTSNLTKDGLAANEYDYGDYFAWGAIEPWYSSKNDVWVNDKEEDGYIDKNAPFYVSGNSTDENIVYSNYNNENEHLQLEHDAANYILKGQWQIPTNEIWEKLYSANGSDVYWGQDGNLSFETQNDIKGMRISRKDDINTYIFLPLAGFIYGKTPEQGLYGYYWSNTSGSDVYSHRLRLDLAEGSVQPNHNGNRYFGFSIRPVRLIQVE